MNKLKFTNIEVGCMITLTMKLLMEVLLFQWSQVPIIDVCFLKFKVSI